ncbi:IS66 family insertion sequence element accessory protein TnpB [Candidatus Dependentiae bacterium]|nr:IS66 family insertion sequence element accessory protein TnpB [Candidatus Dependentiae bacterium]
MRIDWSAVRIFVKPGATDMRKQINALSVLVEEDLGEDPFSGHLYLFCNKNRRRMKILYWDRNGFCLWLKRLEQDRFPWPMSEEACREITGEELAMLLDGIDFFNAHKRLYFSAVS